ncbi:MAG: ribonuclease III [Oscillospiraceae bacterium]|nr:ribonuclease III [Oscillospiraceae bacterium]
MTDYFKMAMTPGDIGGISNLGLAHLGDAVFELLIRAWLVENGKATAKGLHKAAVQYVSAPAQAEAMRRLLPHLTEEEQAMYRRGRNTRINNLPQRASMEEYHAATGLEALFGHLYLKGETDRINELFWLVVEGGEAHVS